MNSSGKPDCVVIDHNERDFHKVTADAKRIESYSGGYNEIKTNDPRAARCGHLLVPKQPQAPQPAGGTITRLRPVCGMSSTSLPVCRAPLITRMAVAASASRWCALSGIGSEPSAVSWYTGFNNSRSRSGWPCGSNPRSRP
jgi:hypothetical protein